MTSPLERIVDEDGRRWQVLRDLGSGGQGRVVLLNDHRHAAKIVAARTDAEREGLRRRFARLRRLDLSDACVASPVALLARPLAGYVMGFLADMVSASALIGTAESTSPAEAYLKSGGLRRRSRLLAHAGEAIAALHDRGLVYVDISPSNVFFSESADAAEAWLIDPDNVAPSVETTAVFTPGYGAPELVVGRRALPDRLTDAHAFATLVYQVLTLRHPFIGDAVENGPPEAEQRAFRGELPFVDDPADQSNTSSRGLPPEVALSPALRELAQKAFGDGRLDRLERPGVASWVRALHAQADLCVDCPSCGSSFRPNRERRCGFCDGKQPAVFRAEVRLWDPGQSTVDTLDLAEPVRLHGAPGASIPVPRRVTQFESGRAARATELDIVVDARDESATIRAENRSEAWVRWRNLSGTWVESLLGRASLKVHRGDEIHFGPRDRPHRVLWCTFVG